MYAPEIFGFFVTLVIFLVLLAICPPMSPVTALFFLILLNSKS